MKRIYVYGLSEERDEEFVEWFEDQFYVSLENWTCLEESVIYMDMDWYKEDCENIVNYIKEKFPETKIEVFEFIMNSTPLIKA